MFEIHKVGCKIGSVVNRAEKHGKELVPAQTIRVSFITSALHLDELDKNLRKSLFKKPAKHKQPSQDDEGEQQEMQLGTDNGDLTEVKLTRVPNIQYKEKLPGYTLFMGAGLTASEMVEQDEVTLSDFVFTPKDGGSVQVEVNLGFKVDEEHAGYFACKVQNLMEITLVPPGKELQVDLVETEEEAEEA